MTKILRAYLVGFLIVFISLGFIGLMVSCDTGSSVSGTTQEVGDDNPGNSDPTDPPINTDPPSSRNIIGRWAIPSEDKYFTFLSDNTFSLNQKDVDGVYRITASGTYSMAYHAVNDGGISLVDTLNDITGTYWYKIEENYPNDRETTLWLDAEWTIESWEQFDYIDGGKW